MKRRALVAELEEMGSSSTLVGHGISGTRWARSWSGAVVHRIECHHARIPWELPERSLVVDEYPAEDGPPFTVLERRSIEDAILVDELPGWIEPCRVCFAPDAIESWDAREILYNEPPRGGLAVAWPKTYRRTLRHEDEPFDDVPE